MPLPIDFIDSVGWPVLKGFDREVWALAGAGQVCLLDRSLASGAGATCTPVRRVLMRGITSTFLQDGAPGTPPERSTIGLVPDKAKRVRIHTPGFPTVTRPVERNVFVLTDHIPQPPETIELLEGRSGPTDPAR